MVGAEEEDRSWQLLPERAVAAGAAKAVAAKAVAVVIATTPVGAGAAEVASERREVP